MDQRIILIFEDVKKGIAITKPTNIATWNQFILIVVHSTTVDFLQHVATKFLNFGREVEETEFDPSFIKDKVQMQK